VSNSPLTPASPNKRLQRTRAALLLQIIRGESSHFGGRRRAPLSRRPFGAILVGLAAIAGLGASRPEAALLELERSGSLCDWRVAIYSSGRATEWLPHGCGDTTRDGSRLWKISPEQLKAIRVAIEKANLEDLPGTIEPATIQSDETFMTIRWRTKTGMRTIHAYGLDRVKDRGRAARFMSVWKAVTAAVPGLR